MSTSARADAPGATSGGDEQARPSAFVTTHWSVVVTAGPSDTTRAQAALEKLCRAVPSRSPLEES